jgi:membrane protein required for beta-lactamase induction
MTTMAKKSTGTSLTTPLPACSNAFDLFAYQLRLERQPLPNLFQHAKKVVSTSDWMVVYREVLSLRLLKQIEDKKNVSSGVNTNITSRS